MRVGTRNAVSRELLEGFATFITLLAEAVIFSKLLSADENFSKPLKISIAAAVMTLFLYHGFELWLIPTGSVVAALGDYFTVEFNTMAANPDLLRNFVQRNKSNHGGQWSDNVNWLGEK